MQNSVPRTFLKIKLYYLKQGIAQTEIFYWSSLTDAYVCHYGIYRTSALVGGLYSLPPPFTPFGFNKRQAARGTGTAKL
jgi:hypothetical protein